MKVMQVRIMKMMTTHPFKWRNSLLIQSNGNKTHHEKEIILCFLALMTIHGFDFLAPGVGLRYGRSIVKTTYYGHYAFY